MSQHRISVDLRIADFECSPEELTNIIGISPTRTWRQGDLVTPRTAHRYKENGWELSSGVSQHESFDNHVNALLDIIEPKIDAFIEIGSKYFATLSCAIYMYDNSENSLPWPHFTKRSMAVLHHIGAEVDFDLYILPSEG